MEEPRETIRRVTAVLLATSVVLILPGMAGVGASLFFAAGLGVAAIGLAAVRESLAAAPTVVGYHLGQYAPHLWLSPVVALGAVVVFPDATPAELQSLGGVAGFVAMVNYFLTPAYDVVYALAGRIGRGLGR